MDNELNPDEVVVLDFIYASKFPGHSNIYHEIRAKVFAQLGQERAERALWECFGKGYFLKNIPLFHEKRTLVEITPRGETLLMRARQKEIHDK